jgi:hypothetical protein
MIEEINIYHGHHILLGALSYDSSYKEGFVSYFEIFQYQQQYCHVLSGVFYDASLPL